MNLKFVLIDLKIQNFIAQATILFKVIIFCDFYKYLYVRLNELCNCPDPSAASRAC